MNLHIEVLDTCEAQRKFVEPEEYRQLMISCRNLVRRDDRPAGLRGLWDAAASVWYVIEEERLYASQFSSREPAQTVGA